MAHVLMVDSDLELTHVYAQYLLEAGHTVTARYDIDSADAFLRKTSDQQRKPDAITLELMMPQGKELFPFPEELEKLLEQGGEKAEKAIELQHWLHPGIAFYDRIRRVHGYQGPVILLTHMESDVMQNSFKQAGCGYAVKEDTHPSKLVDLVEQYTTPQTRIDIEPARFLYRVVLRWKKGAPAFVVGKPDIVLRKPVVLPPAITV